MSTNKYSNTALRILVVDDEINIRKTLSICLESEGHQVISVKSFSEAVETVNRNEFDLAFVDLRLGTENGLDLIPLLLGILPLIKIIIITAYATIDSAVEAMRRGASDYIQKPFTPAQVVLSIQKVLEIRSLERRVVTLQDDLKRDVPEFDFTSKTLAMQRAIMHAHQVASSDAIILLCGESGTGKTILARAIHEWSNRSNKPFVVVSCPTLPGELLESELFGHVKGAFTGAIRDNPGRIALCEGGTLFLDEISELPLSTQPKLLRFIQDKEYERLGDRITRKAEVRIITATNIDLEQAVREKRFREDLYYRLDVIRIDIPPLRERQEDIIELAEKLLIFLGRNNHRIFKGFSEEAKKILKQYTWPGNIRELRNMIERIAILCDSEWIDARDLPEKLAAGETAPQPGILVSISKIEEIHIRQVLSQTKSLQEAAAILGIDQATLWRKRKIYGI
ncbi:MAG: sigma-54 dependent transcriptional regulator [Patescibacteria group bacterium]|nr:sigma-54 dependent transcriptional regulator [Patescibacteria group bacterium]